MSNPISASIAGFLPTCSSPENLSSSLSAKTLLVSTGDLSLSNSINERIEETRTLKTEVGILTRQLDEARGCLAELKDQNAKLNAAILQLREVRLILEARIEFLETYMKERGFNLNLSH